MNKKRWIISLSAVAAIGLSFNYFFAPAKAKKAPDAAFSGIVEQQEYDLSFKIGGRLESLPVEEGQMVKKGDLIGRLEKGEWQAKVDQAKAAVALASANVGKAAAGVGVVDQATQAKVEQAQAALQTAQAKFTELSNGARPQEIAQLEAKVNAAESAFNNAEDMRNKMNHLYQQGAVPQSKRDEADLAYDKARADLTSAQQALAMAKEGARQEDLAAAKHQVEQAQGVLNEALSGKGQVNVSQADVKVAQGQLEQAKGSLEEAEVYLSYTELHAPIDGIVVHKNVKAGEMVSQGFTAVTLADPKDKWVKFYVPENKLNGLQVNQGIPLTIPALNQQVTGTVVSINPAPQFAAKKATNYLQETDVRSFEVKVKIKDLTDKIYAGMTAEWQGATTS